MHISESRESPNTILTKCAKMNENSHKKLGINGNSDGTVLKVKEEYPKNYYAPPTSGGRLKFFKDGKFILELERAKEGERVSWVSVPRKTFWPPQGVATTVTCKQEGSTSLSISDDNSSIQSSPWQRDHFWKQTTPRRNLSKELSFFYRRSKNAPVPIKSNKARRPYSADPDPFKSDRKTVTKMCNKFMNCKKRRSLLVIVQDLVDKSASKSPLRIDTVVSPRKRFLREMEKDRNSLEDGNLKRSKNKVIGNQASVSSAVGGASPLRMNGHTEDKQVAPSTVAAKNCSYSITSLLSDDRVTVKRSPSNSPSHFVPVTTSAAVSQMNFNMVKSEDPWYSENVEKFRSIELSHVEKNSFHSFPHPPYMPSFVYPYSFPNCYGYGRGFPSMPQPVYHHPPAHHLPVPMMRQEAPSCSWKTDRMEQGNMKEENSLSDMPLNLSKHAG